MKLEDQLPHPPGAYTVLDRPIPYREAEFPALVTVANEYPGREYTVSIQIPEFTCLCPMTGLPDFAEFRVEYVPDQLLIELKSLKYYIGAYRNVGIFHEAATNKVLEDLVSACQPLRMEVTADFHVRGGIRTVVRASYQRP